MEIVKDVVEGLAKAPTEHLVMLVGLGALALAAFAIHAVLVIAKKGSEK